MSKIQHRNHHTLQFDNTAEPLLFHRHGLNLIDILVKHQHMFDIQPEQHVLNKKRKQLFLFSQLTAFVLS